MDELGSRMKSFEQQSKLRLDKNLPLIGRVDGKAFHTFTKGLEKPWDDGLQKSMVDAALYAAERIQGCKVVYVQSDEISFLITAFENPETQGWFDYKVEKMASVAASLVTGGFLMAMTTNLLERFNDILSGSEIPAFDARFFNVPHNEVVNYFWWRQADAVRNSVQGLARAHFSYSQCCNKNSEQLKQMLLDSGTSWEEQEHRYKYGVAIRKVLREEEVSYQVHGDIFTTTALRSKWEIDNNVPLFYQQRDYFDSDLK